MIALDALYGYFSAPTVVVSALLHCTVLYCTVLYCTVLQAAAAKELAEAEAAELAAEAEWSVQSFCCSVQRACAPAPPAQPASSAD